MSLTQDFLESVLPADRDHDPKLQMPQLPDAPSYSMLLELLEFAENIASSVQSRSRATRARTCRKVLKLLVDLLFPLCSISRADKLEKRIRSLLLPLHSLSENDKEAFLQKIWKPQPTGMHACMPDFAYCTQTIIRLGTCIHMRLF